MRVTIMSPSLKILVQFVQHVPLCPRVFAQTASVESFAQMLN